MVAEEVVHLCITPGWTSALYYDKLQLRLPEGVLPYIEVVNELLLLTQRHERKGTKNVHFQKKATNIAPANNRNQTTERNSYT